MQSGMTFPDWFTALVESPLAEDGRETSVQGRTVVPDNGVLRAVKFLSDDQSQTSETFGFKWHKRDTFEGEVANNMRRWLKQKYGDVSSAFWFAGLGPDSIVLDAGCGAALSAIELFAPVLKDIRYIGADVSRAVDVARERFAERGVPAAFIQADLQQLPLPPESVDLIFSEGVLHHCDDTETALTAVTRHLKPGGRILFYVYRKKGPVREFTDDYIRGQLQPMSQQAAWDAVMPLSKLGQVLGELDIEVEVPEAVDLLEIPAGRINLQRLFYWHVFKAFYQPEMNIEEMNHINYDWYAPKNAHRHTPEEVREWCRSLGLTIEHEKLEEAGITVIARKG